MFGIDGNAIDMATILIGAGSVFVRPVRNLINGQPANFDRRDCAVDFLNGATLVTFIMLVGCAFWTALMQEVLKSKVSLPLAGGMGVLFLLGEILGGEKRNGGPR